MALFKQNYSKEEKREMVIVFVILAVSIISGILIGSNEEWVATRNRTAGYMAGSLTTAVLLFGVYRSISFFFEEKRDQHA